EEVLLQANLSVPTYGGMQGTGVEAATITETRDALLDQQIQAETSTTGSLTSQQTALQYIQDSLGEQLQGSGASGSSVSTTGGLADDLGGLFNSFQALSTDPSSLTDRQSAIAAGQQ